MSESYEQISRKALMHGPLEALYCCIGDPVVGNPTQLMIEAAFRDLQFPARYLTCTVGTKALGAAITGIRALGFAGANVTAPHKVAVMEFLDDLTTSARLSGAVNCIYNQDGKLVGDNTDGKGFLQSIQEMTPIEGLRVLVLGAGGASRAIVTELALHGAQEILIANRTESKAQQIVEALDGKVATRLRTAGLETGFTIGHGFDLIVQGTSVGLFDARQMLDIRWEKGSHTGQLAADVVFNPVNTAFLQKAGEAGASTVDGLGMLVNQGAFALIQWTGRNASRTIMRAALEIAFASFAS